MRQRSLVGIIPKYFIGKKLLVSIIVIILLVAVVFLSRYTSDVVVSELQAEISHSQLSEANGLDGQKCWAAVDGRVYDLSNSFNWENGAHTTSEGLASCGRDLSDVIDLSPHGRKILDQLDVVGELTD